VVIGDHGAGEHELRVGDRRRDAGGGVVTWNIGALAAGGSGSVQLVVAVTSPLANGTILTNGTSRSTRTKTASDQRGGDHDDGELGTRADDLEGGRSRPGGGRQQHHLHAELRDTGNASDGGGDQDTVPANTGVRVGDRRRNAGGGCGDLEHRGTGGQRLRDGANWSWRWRAAGEWHPHHEQHVQR